jgi:SAM-dependent methyltransferase
MGGGTRRGRCPACHGELARWRIAPSSEPGAPGPVTLLRCLRCGGAVTGGVRPSDDLHDSGAYGSRAPRLSALAQPVLHAFDRGRLSLLEAWAPPRSGSVTRSLLDVGAGRGRFVASARRAGYAAQGLEPSHRGVTGAAATYAVALAQQTVESATVEAGSIDVICLWHVLEHLDDPDGAMIRVTGWLAPGGVVLVGVPNLASLQARLGGRSWFHLDLPRHRTHFTPAGLHALLHRHGLEVCHTHHLLAEHNPFGMWQSLISRFTRQPSYLYNLLKHNAPAASSDLAVSVLGLGLAVPAVALELAAGAARRGGTIAVLARRPGDQRAVQP